MRDLNTLAKNRANEVRNSFGLGDGPIPNIFSLLENQGIYLFKRPFLGNASAMFMKTEDAHLVIINSNKTLGHQIFSAAHELSHYLYDRNIMGGICAVEKINQDLEIERLADLFATHFLMPEDGVLKHLFKRTSNGSRNIDYTDIIYLQQYFNVSWSAMLNRLYNIGQIRKNEYDNFKATIKIIREAALLGYDTDIYEKDKCIYNSQIYIENVIKAFKSEVISENKLDELLSDIDTSISNLSLDDSVHSILYEEDYYA